METRPENTEKQVQSMAWTIIWFSLVPAILAMVCLRQVMASKNCPFGWIILFSYLAFSWLSDLALAHLISAAPNREDM